MPEMTLESFANLKMVKLANYSIHYDIILFLAVGVVGVPKNIRMVESTTKSLTLSWTVSSCVISLDFPVYE